MRKPRVSTSALDTSAFARRDSEETVILAKVCSAILKLLLILNLDINECTELPKACSKTGSVCTNTAGGFICGCPEGFQDNGAACTPSSTTPPTPTGPRPGRLSSSCSCKTNLRCRNLPDLPRPRVRHQARLVGSKSSLVLLEQGN